MNEQSTHPESREEAIKRQSEEAKQMWREKEELEVRIRANRLKDLDPKTMDTEQIVILNTCHPSQMPQEPSKMPESGIFIPLPPQDSGIDWNDPETVRQIRLKREGSAPRFRIEWAYPSSPAVVSYGFGEIGCWVIEKYTPKSSIILSGHATREEAEQELSKRINAQ